MKYALAGYAGLLAYLAFTSAVVLLVDHAFGNGWGWALIPFTVLGGWAIGAGIGTIQSLIRKATS